MRSGIGRLIDVRHGSNRFVVVAAVVGGAIHFSLAAFTGSDFSESFRASFLGGGATFLAWAIGRELDPDDPVAANLASLAGFALAFIGDPSLIVGGVVLLAARIVARTTGIPPQPIDLVVLVLAAGYVGTRPAGILAVSALGLALVADRVFPGDTPGVNTLGAVAIVVVGSTAALLGGSWPDFVDPSVLEWAVVAAGIMAVGASFAIPEPESSGDYGEQRLHHMRMQAARMLAAGTSLSYLVVGAAGITGLGPAWAAFYGAAFTAIRRRPSRTGNF